MKIPRRSTRIQHQSGELHAQVGRSRLVHQTRPVCAASKTGTVDLLNCGRLKPWPRPGKRNLLAADSTSRDAAASRLFTPPSPSLPARWSKTKLLKFGVYTFIFRPMFAPPERARAPTSSGKYGSVRRG